MPAPGRGRGSVTEDRILAFCADPHGLADVGDLFEPQTRRAIVGLLSRGLIERRERTVLLPAIAGTADFHEAREVTLASLHRIPGPNLPTFPESS